MASTTREDFEEGKEFGVGLYSSSPRHTDGVGFLDFRGFANCKNFSPRPLTSTVDLLFPKIVERNILLVRTVFRASYIQSLFLLYYDKGVVYFLRLTPTYIGYRYFIGVLR